MAYETIGRPHYILTIERDPKTARARVSWISPRVFDRAQVMIREKSFSVVYHKEQSEKAKVSFLIENDRFGTVIGEWFRITRKDWLRLLDVIRVLDNKVRMVLYSPMGNRIISSNGTIDRTQNRVAFVS